MQLNNPYIFFIISISLHIFLILLISRQCKFILCCLHLCSSVKCQYIVRGGGVTCQHFLNDTSFHSCITSNISFYSCVTSNTSSSVIYLVPQSTITVSPRKGWFSRAELSLNTNITVVEFGCLIFTHISVCLFFRNNLHTCQCVLHY